MSSNDTIINIVGDVSELKADMKHVLRTLEQIQATCKRNCDRALEPQEPSITAKLMLVVGGVASAVSAVVIALISAIPPTISAISAWFQQKP